MGLKCHVCKLPQADWPVFIKVVKYGCENNYTWNLKGRLPKCSYM